MNNGWTRNARARSALCLAASLLAGSIGCAHADADSERRAGDVLHIALPLATLGAELMRGEREGAWQYATALTASALANEALERMAHVERPDHSNFHSFPSGHATLAFSSATYVHRRYGLEYAWPLYAAATYVGYTRVRSHRHRWGDVAGGAALAGGMSWWLVQPKASQQVTVLPVILDRGFGVVVQASW